ncbi:AAA family ATPase, partial [Pseudomonas gingeri]|uniref:AAA family ATPase n=1 Tax=Pseudomonas gingeri TaxID=117681 RepID=UPI00159FE2DE
KLPDVGQPDLASGNQKPLQPALLILGENSAGKSTILEAAALALCSDEARSDLQLEVMALPLNPELMGATFPQSNSASVTLTFENDESRTLTITGGVYQIEGKDHLLTVFAYG